MDFSSALGRYRISLGVFIVGLVLSGVTAFPLLWELKMLTQILGVGEASSAEGYSGLNYWILTVRWGLEETYARAPWLGYGTDWLAFGHLVIALFFGEPWKNPLPNRWVLKVGLVACFGVIPLALICGAVRGIPFYWRLVDCSFGVVGAVPLLYCLSLLPKIAEEKQNAVPGK